MRVRERIRGACVNVRACVRRSYIIIYIFYAISIALVWLLHFTISFNALNDIDTSIILAIDFFGASAAAHVAVVCCCLRSVSSISADTFFYFASRFFLLLEMCVCVSHFEFNIVSKIS